MHVLIGETLSDTSSNALQDISKELERINLELATNKERQRKRIRVALGGCLILLIVFLMGILLMNSPYLEWDYSDPEYAVVGVLWHGFEWVFVRLFPLALIGVCIGLYRNRRN